MGVRGYKLSHVSFQVISRLSPSCAWHSQAEGIAGFVYLLLFQSGIFPDLPPHGQCQPPPRESQSLLYLWDPKEIQVDTQGTAIQVLYSIFKDVRFLPQSPELFLTHCLG
jgi:hypothetical protein